MACCSPWGHKASDMIDQLNNNSYDISSHNFENWPQGNGKKTDPEIKDYLYLKQQRWYESDHHMTNFNMIIRANRVVSQAALCPACALLRFPFKSTCPLISKREFVLWNMNPPSPQGCQLSQQSNLSFYPTVVSQYWILEWWAADSVIWTLRVHGGLHKWEGYGLVWYGSSHRGVWGRDEKNYEAETRLWTNSTFY